MQLNKKIRWMFIAGLVAGTIFLPLFINPLLKSSSPKQAQDISLLGLHPRPAEGDLAFDRYLNNMIAGQTPQGTLPSHAPPTLRGTFLAVQALGMLGFGSDVNSADIQSFVTSCYNFSSHLFSDAATNAFEHGFRVSGYSVIEATYYAIATLDLLSALTPLVWQATANAILDLQDASGGFACRSGLCTVHDTFFAYKALELLGNEDMVNTGTLGSFLDGRQASDPSRWWEFGAFTNLPSTAGDDADFSVPNLVTSYYAVATLAACGQLTVLNGAGLVQFMNLLKNISSNLYSYAAGNERAEHVGTTYLLALDQYLTEDSSINYSSAGTALLARVEAGIFNEGRMAPANHTLSPACEIVWGLSKGGRLGELTTAAKEKLRVFITSHLVALNSLGGYALTRDAAFHELANLLPAITGAGKIDAVSINALYAYVKNYYYYLYAYFSADGTALLQRDLPSFYNPTSPDGAYSSGIAATLPALQVLKVIGRLNDFLGETHNTGNILGNISASQFINASAPNVTGAFCPQASFAGACTGKEGIRSYIIPQWTLQSLEAIAILDPSNPTSHFNATAAWQYLSQYYDSNATDANFTKPVSITVSDVEWTCRVASALCHGGMAGYFSPAKVNSWILTHLNASSAREVSWHLRFLSSVTGLARAPYAIATLNTLKDGLVGAGDAWYSPQGGTWPDTDIVGILAQFRADRQIYLMNTVIPDPMAFGDDNSVSVDVSNLFAVDMPPNATVTFSALGTSITLTPGLNGHYNGVFRCSYNYSCLGPRAFNFAAARGGWQSTFATGIVTFAGTLVASVTCGSDLVTNGTTLALKGTQISLETVLQVKLGEGKSAAESLEVYAIVYAGEAAVANVTLATRAAGIYAGLYEVSSAGTYSIEVVVQGTILARFNVTLDGSSKDFPDGFNLATLPASLFVGTAIGGIIVIGVGTISNKGIFRKKCDRKPP